MKVTDRNKCLCPDCLHKVKLPSIDIRGDPDLAAAIDPRSYMNDLKPKNKKLFEELIKTRTAYNDTRDKILSSTKYSFHKGKAIIKRKNTNGLQNGDHKEKDTVRTLVDLIDKGKIFSPQQHQGHLEPNIKVSDCCTCCSCHSIFDFRKHKHHSPDRKQENLHNEEFHSKPKFADKYKKLVRYKSKDVHSDPCFCTENLSEFIKNEALSRKSKRQKIETENVMVKKPKVSAASKALKASRIFCECKLEDVSRKSFEKVKTAKDKLMSSVRSNLDVIQTSLRNTKNSIEIIRDKMQLRKLRKQMECEPGICIPEECIPLECYEKIKLRDKIRDIVSGVSIRAEPKIKEIRKRISKMSHKEPKPNSVICSCKPVSKSISSMVNLPYDTSETKKKRGQLMNGPLTNNTRNKKTGVVIDIKPNIPKKRKSLKKMLNGNFGGGFEHELMFPRECLPSMCIPDECDYKKCAEILLSHSLSRLKNFTGVDTGTNTHHEVKTKSKSSQSNDSTDRETGFSNNTNLSDKSILVKTNKNRPKHFKINKSNHSLKRCFCTLKLIDKKKKQLKKAVRRSNMKIIAKPGQGKSFDRIKPSFHRDKFINQKHKVTNENRMSFNGHKKIVKSHDISKNNMSTNNLGVPFCGSEECDATDCANKMKTCNTKHHQKNKVNIIPTITKTSISGGSSKRQIFHHQGRRIPINKNKDMPHVIRITSNLKFNVGLNDINLHNDSNNFKSRNKRNQNIHQLNEVYHNKENKKKSLIKKCFCKLKGLKRNKKYKAQVQRKKHRKIKRKSQSCQCQSDIISVKTKKLSPIPNESSNTTIGDYISKSSGTSKSYFRAKAPVKDNRIALKHREFSENNTFGDKFIVRIESNISTNISFHNPKSKTSKRMNDIARKKGRLREHVQHEASSNKIVRTNEKGIVSSNSKSNFSTQIKMPKMKTKAVSTRQKKLTSKHVNTNNVINQTHAARNLKDNSTEPFKRNLTKTGVSSGTDQKYPKHKTHKIQSVLEKPYRSKAYAENDISSTASPVLSVRINSNINLDVEFDDDVFDPNNVKIKSNENVYAETFTPKKGTQKQIYFTSNHVNRNFNIKSDSEAFIPKQHLSFLNQNSCADTDDSDESTYSSNTSNPAQRHRCCTDLVNSLYFYPTRPLQYENNQETQILNAIHNNSCTYSRSSRKDMKTKNYDTFFAKDFYICYMLCQAPSQYSIAQLQLQNKQSIGDHYDCNVMDNTRSASSVYITTSCNNSRQSNKSLTSTLFSGINRLICYSYISAPMYSPRSTEKIIFSNNLPNQFDSMARFDLNSVILFSVISESNISLSLIKIYLNKPKTYKLCEYTICGFWETVNKSNPKNKIHIGIAMETTQDFAIYSKKNPQMHSKKTMTNSRILKRNKFVNNGFKFYSTGNQSHNVTGAIHCKSHNFATFILNGIRRKRKIENIFIFNPDSWDDKNEVIVIMPYSKKKFHKYESRVCLVNQCYLDFIGKSTLCGSKYCKTSKGKSNLSVLSNKISCKLCKYSGSNRKYIGVTDDKLFFGKSSKRKNALKKIVCECKLQDSKLIVKKNKNNQVVKTVVKKSKGTTNILYY